MSILSFLLGEKKRSASVAKERLQLIIAHERGGKSPSSYLPDLQRDLVAVISKYVQVSDKDITVNLDRQDDFEVLEVKIEIPQA